VYIIVNVTLFFQRTDEIAQEPIISHALIEHRNLLL